MTASRSRARLALALIAATLAAGTSGVQAQSVRLLGDFQNWSSYAAADGAGAICFSVTRPTATEPSPDGYGQAYLYITHRAGEGTRNEVNLVAGYGFAAGTTATATVSGQAFPLFTEGDAAWLENTAQADNLVGAMRAGSTVSVEGTSADGTKVRQTFSLSGATAATNAINSECR